MRKNIIYLYQNKKISAILLMMICLRRERRIWQGRAFSTTTTCTSVQYLIRPENGRRLQVDVEVGVQRVVAEVILRKRVRTIQQS
jgi:hypothetical protein